MNEAPAAESATASAPTTWASRFGPWLWAPFVAAAPGWTSAALADPDIDALVRSNADPQPGLALVHMLAGALIVVGLWAWLGPRLARARGCSRVQGWLEAVLATRLLLVAPLALTLIHDPEAFGSATRLVLIPAGALLVAISVGRWPGLSAGGRDRLRRLLGGERWPLVVCTVGVGLASLWLLRLALWRHYGFATRAFDLGIYDNLVWNTAHGNFLVCTLIKGGVHTAAHFDPILALLAPIYRLAPRAETLIVVQLVWVVSGAIPVYAIARRRLDDRVAATILCLGFALYPSVHGVVLFEFHSLALLAVPGLWMIWALDAERPAVYWVAFALALLVREDASLFVTGVGVYGLLATPQRKQAALTIGLALAWLAVVKFALMPDSDLLMRNSELNYTYANRYRRLVPEGGSTRDALATLLTNPSFVLAHVLTTTKILAAGAMLVPLGLVPLASGRRLLLAVYGAAFMFLASHKSIYYPLFHYSTVLYPVLFAAAPAGIERLEGALVRLEVASGRARAQVLAYLAACLVLGSLAMGAIVEVAPFQLSRGIVRELDAAERERYEWFRAQIEAIPADAAVTASNRVAPHLSNRAELYIVQQQVETAWIVIDRRDLRPEDATWLFYLVEAGRYEEVATFGQRFRLLRRVHSAQRKP